MSTGSEKKESNVFKGLGKKIKKIFLLTRCFCRILFSCVVRA
jgi:hypothetical protein